jgi:hypothetical protein
MLVENYPFTSARPGDVARPYLPVTIINPENSKQLNFFALLDTGADECAFPASFAAPLVIIYNMAVRKRYAPATVLP